jgi:hypothetical protein
MSGIKTKFDAVAARKYTTRDGQEKTQWINIGRAVEWDDGGIEVELTSVPVGDWWNGKVKLFVQKDKQQAPTAQAKSPPRQKPSDDFEDDNIPF